MKHAARSVQAELGKRVYITKAHFDVELDSLKILWRRMKSLHLALNTLRPIFSLMPAGESPEEKRQRLERELSKNMDSFEAAYNAALAAVEDQLPFYPEAIHESATSALKVAALGINMIQINSQRFSTTWYIDGSKNQQAYSSHLSRIEQGIREHMERLSIRS